MAVQVCQAAGAVLIVDEAHGSHLGLHDALPASALQQGAHVVVQSTHKTLGALTQAAMLHIAHGAEAGAEGRIHRYLTVLHTSSPSYLLLASLDAAASAVCDPFALAPAVEAASAFRSGLAALGMRTLDSSTASVACIDPLRVTCLATDAGISGFELAQQLCEAGVEAELATERTVVFALGIGSRLAHVQRALHVLQNLLPAGTAAAKQAAAGPDVALPREETAVDLIDMRAALHESSVEVPCDKAIGARSAALVSVYPPGIPVFVLGEVIGASAVQRLKAAVAAGGRVVGCAHDLSNVAVCASDVSAAPVLE